jgi:hypothetical protein
MSERQETLTQAGAARREAMLRDLVTVMHRTHRARRLRRRAITATCGIIIVGAAIRMAYYDSDHHRAGPMPVEYASTGTEEPGRRPGESDGWRTTEFIHTDPVIKVRLAARPDPVVERIDDDTVITLLARLQRPAGLVRIGDRVAFTAPVTDEELDRSRSDLP